MASSFHASCQPGSPQPRVVILSVDTAATFTTGAWVYLDTADNLIKECGADPATILGITRSSAADAIAGNCGLPAGKIAVSVFEPGQTWIMGSATTAAESLLTDKYGIVKTSGVWLVDTAETTSKIVTVVDYGPKTGEVGKEYLVVKIEATALQGDGIIS